MCKNTTFQSIVLLGALCLVLVCIILTPWGIR